MGSESDNLERTVISTYGSFIADSLIEWTKVNIPYSLWGNFKYKLFLASCHLGAE